MQKDKELKKEIYSEVKKNWKNNFNDNWDYVLFGDESKINTTFKGHLNNYAKKWLPKKLYFDFIFRYFFKGNIEGLKSMYQKLEANYSKELLVKILTYRLIGHKKYKLPLSTPKYWEDLKFAETLIVERDKIINPDFLDFILYIHDLTPIGLPFKLYFTPLGILIDFIIKQYEYNQDGVMIKVNEGDVVIDAGGCWGDTALFFANEAGAKGKVYSFEFIPGNIEIFNRNIALNENLRDRISIVKNPLWNASETRLFYKDFGPASTVSTKEFIGSSGECKTITIDDFVIAQNLNKIDFIKMDIEGAEPFCIEGAKQTIIKYQPKLAIAIYHNISDFYTIVNFIDNLNLGYKFYLQHTTIHAGETVLFAQN